VRRKKFLRIYEEIKKQRETPEESWKYAIGREREEKTVAILREMKKEGLIWDFLPTGDLSFQNIMEGIDFFVVFINSAYKICPLSVTGERWLREHRDRHPEIPVIAINPSDTSTSIKSKIMEALNHK